MHETLDISQHYSRFITYKLAENARLVESPIICHRLKKNNLKVKHQRKAAYSLMLDL